MPTKSDKNSPFERVLRSIDRRTAPEARELRRALLRLKTKAGWVTWDRAYEAAAQIILAGDRTLARRASDRKTDHLRRVLVGERIPWDVAQTYKAQAEALGWSMYRWTVEALRRGYEAIQTEGARAPLEKGPPEGLAYAVWDGSDDLTDPANL